MHRQRNGMLVFYVIKLVSIKWHRAIATLLALQHPSGGFAGGPGQFPHLLPTYAAICSLAIVGKSGEDGGWEKINRLVIIRILRNDI